MFGIGSVVVTLILLGGALAQVEEVVTVIPGLGGESFPVKKRSIDKPIEIFELPFEDDIFPFELFDLDVDGEPRPALQDVIVHLQSMPIEFNFEEVIPARLKRAAGASKDKTMHLQQQRIPFDLDFIIRDKREAAKDKTMHLQQQRIPFDLDFIIRDKRDVKEKKVQLQEQIIPFDLDFVIRDKRGLFGGIPSLKKPRNI